MEGAGNTGGKIEMLVGEIKEKLRKIEEAVDEIAKIVDGDDVARARKARESLLALSVDLSNAAVNVFWVKGERI